MRLQGGLDPFTSITLTVDVDEFGLPILNLLQSDFLNLLYTDSYPNLRFIDENDCVWWAEPTEVNDENGNSVMKLISEEDRDSLYA